MEFRERRRDAGRSKSLDISSAALKANADHALDGGWEGQEGGIGDASRRCRQILRGGGGGWKDEGGGKRGDGGKGVIA